MCKFRVLHPSFLCLVAVLLFKSVKLETLNIKESNVRNASSVTKVLLSDILKDFGELSQDGEKEQLEEAESKTDLKRTLVALKKHKNYEILVYEYSGEEDFDENEDEDSEKQLQVSTTTPRSQKTPANNSSRRNRKKQQTPKDDKAISSTTQSTIQNETATYANQEITSSTTQSQLTAESQKPVTRKYEERREGPGLRGNIAVSFKKPKIIIETSSEEIGDEKEEPDEFRPVEWGQREVTSGSMLNIEEKKEPKVKDANKNEMTMIANLTQEMTIVENKTQQNPKEAPGAGKFMPRRRLTVETSLNVSFPEEYEDDGEEEERGPIPCADPSGKEGICEEYFKCSFLYATKAGKINLQDYKCKLGNEIGICCPLLEEQDIHRGQHGRSLMKINELMKPLSRQIRNLVRSNVNNSFAFGSDSTAQLEEIEQDLFFRGGQVTKETPAFSHNRFFPSSKKIRQVSQFGFELLQTTNDLSERLELTNEVGGLGLKTFKSSNTRVINDRCPRLAPCGINKYRLPDGSCNNLRRPKMGQALTPLSRVLEPAYGDGRWEPRISVDGFLLPSARLLSQRIIKDRDNPDSKYSLMVMQFGQFIDHDISSVPIFTFENGTGISCCRSGQFLPPQDRHPNCMPVEIPLDDPFYSQFGQQRCMNFVRSRIAPRIDCSLGYADQMNAVTHWLDLSNVYGSSRNEMRDLRLFQGGLLQFSELADKRQLLPLKRTSNGEVDYRAGDDRVNEMQGLMVMHLIWLREHNRVALELQSINPYWNDEQLFQEARRIVISEYQHIIYNEWLPIIVGRQYMQSYDILPQSRKTYFRGYDPEIDASIESSFSSAAFRMGHSLVQGLVRLINEFGQANEAVAISNHADNALRTRAPNQVDKWIRGLAQQPIQSFDNFVSQHLNGRLFQARGGFFGMDLSALNIQRSRDHGVPGYNAFRELCQTGKRARTFDDFKDWIPPEIVNEMQNLYGHPDDVDLWIGGISETPLVGALVGPTFTCLIGDQFARTKKGDRYFYDVGDQTHSFSPEQLQELRKASMARILCDNGDELEAMQPSVFLQSDFDFNSLVDCKSRRIPRVNLKLWENEPTP